MHIRRLTAYVVRLPLKRPFVHASAVREESENVLIRCELADGTAPPAERPAAEDGEAGTHVEPSVSNGDAARAAEHTAHPAAGRTAVIGTAAEGLREFRRILSTAVIRRWPLYLRNVKQIIRQTDSSFDERAYGFGNLTDLLRAAHREGIVRVDRDRQGVIRVFQGSAPIAPAPPDETADSSSDVLQEDAAVAAAAAEIGVPLIAAVADEAPADEGREVGARAVEAEVAPAETPRKRRSRAARPTTSRPRRAKKTA